MKPGAPEDREMVPALAWMAEATEGDVSYSYG